MELQNKATKPREMPVEGNTYVILFSRISSVFLMNLVGGYAILLSLIGCTCTPIDWPYLLSFMLLGKSANVAKLKLDSPFGNLIPLLNVYNNNNNSIYIIIYLENWIVCGISPVLGIINHYTTEVCGDGSWARRKYWEPCPILSILICHFILSYRIIMTLIYIACVHIYIYMCVCFCLSITNLPMSYCIYIYTHIIIMRQFLSTHGFRTVISPSWRIFMASSQFFTTSLVHLHTLLFGVVCHHVGR
jgi:hypothetical protein